VTESQPTKHRGPVETTTTTTAGKK
jgi:hypothetical protein